MEHWFDNLTKGLAYDKLSRRAMLRSTLKAGLAAAGAALLGRSGGMAQAILAGSEGPQEGNTCRVSHEGREQVLSLSATSTFKGKPLSFEQTTKHVAPKGNTTVSKTFKFAGNTLLHIEATGRANSTQIDITYGNELQGIKRASFTSTNGKTLQGVIDNRRLLPFKVGANPKSLKFADGKPPPPDIKVSDEIVGAIKAISAQAKQVAAKCSASRAHHTAALSSDAHTLNAMTQGDSGHGSTPQTSGGCIACEGGCTVAGIACGIGAAAICAATWGIGCAAAIAGCVIAEIGCWAACHASGAPCCPVTCGDVACCDKAETCLDPNRGVCCAKGLIACSAKHCCKPSDTCINATGFCCPKDQIVCNKVCCKSGEVCKDGVACCPPTQVICGGKCCGPNQKCAGGKCCPGGQTCGDICCDELSKCADPKNGLCCSFASQVCNGLCCKPGEQCIDGKCCSEPCGKVCCGPNEACQDPKTSKCVSIPCPPKQVTCISKEGPDKFGAALCCPPNVACCLGKCCKPNELCCSGPGTPYGCHDPNQCIA